MRIPQVTGISPKEGPPGTRVTIRGENLGVDARDLIGLRICGSDCLMTAEWKSPKQIVARTGQAKGKGEIIVVTRSGGVGSCTVVFRGYNIQIGPLAESAVWVDETQTYSTMFGRNKTTAPITSQEQDDPLGISDESNETKFRDGELAEMFPDGSGDTSLENFVPAWYLLENHHQTSFGDLKSGLCYLKRKSSQRDEGPMTFVKANLTTFMDCYDTLTDMHEKMSEDKSKALGGSVTQPLEETLQKANKAADALFLDVLGRKDRADATRNALSVLQRFKFLFNLPCSMDRNIKKGDYDLLITDYTRAKSLFGDTDVQIFQKVCQEVEKHIGAFRDMLYKQLMELPSTPEEQKRLIRYLTYLETPGDPAWECLLNMQKWLLNLLQSCKDEHMLKEQERERAQHEEAQGPLSPRLSTPPVNRHTSFKSGGKAPEKVLLVEHMARILTETLPDLWRLGLAYFSGKLVKDTKKTHRVDPAQLEQFKQMVLEVIQLFSHLVRGALLPASLQHLSQEQRDKFGRWFDTKQEPIVGWLPFCVRYVRSCSSSLSNLDLSPEALEVVQQLTFDMRVHCMTTLLKQAVGDIKKLHGRETWVVDADDERGGTTLLPTLFENIVMETVQHLHEVIQAKTGENEIFGELAIQKSTSELVCQLLQSFAGTLEQLATIGNVEQKFKHRRSAVKPELLAREGEGMPSLDKRFIIMMSNCSHTLEAILPRLVDNLRKHTYPDMDVVQQTAVRSYKQVDERLFDHYIEEKSNPIIGVLEQNMYAGKFDWNNCRKPTGIRSYIKEAITGIIKVHAEVYSISPIFVSRVMSRLVEYVADEVSRLFQCTTGFSTNGALQARLDLYALDTALGVYRTEETQAAFREALDCIEEVKTPDDKKLLEELLNRFRHQMRIQLTCFQSEQKGQR